MSKITIYDFLTLCRCCFLLLLRFVSVAQFLWRNVLVSSNPLLENFSCLYLMLVLGIPCFFSESNKHWFLEDSLAIFFVIGQSYCSFARYRLNVSLKSFSTIWVWTKKHYTLHCLIVIIKSVAVITAFLHWYHIVCVYRS